MTGSKAMADPPGAARSPAVLADLPLRRPARVTFVGGSRSIRRRLMEMGLVPGTDVVVQGVSPLGDPMELAVRGGRLSIRHQEARCVEVAE